MDDCTSNSMSCNLLILAPLFAFRQQCLTLSLTSPFTTCQTVSVSFWCPDTGTYCAVIWACSTVALETWTATAHTHECESQEVPTCLLHSLHQNMPGVGLIGGVTKNPWDVKSYNFVLLEHVVPASQFGRNSPQIEIGHVCWVFDKNGTPFLVVTRLQVVQPCFIKSWFNWVYFPAPNNELILSVTKLCHP